MKPIFRANSFAGSHTSLCAKKEIQAAICTGDQRPGVKPADIVFVVEEKAHARFKREGNDLSYTHRLPLVEALCGPSFRVQTLDGRNVPVTVQSSVGPNSVKVRCCLVQGHLLMFKCFHPPHSFHRCSKSLPSNCPSQVECILLRLWYLLRS